MEEALFPEKKCMSPEAALPFLNVGRNRWENGVKFLVGEDATQQILRNILGSQSTQD